MTFGFVGSLLTADLVVRDKREESQEEMASDDDWWARAADADTRQSPASGTPGAGHPDRFTIERKQKKTDSFTGSVKN